MGRPKKQLDPTSAAALEVVNRDRQQEELQQSEQQLREKAIAMTAEFVGTIKAMNFMRSLSEITVLVKLKDLKESKHYKTAGMTWDETCEAMGLSRRTVDERLAALEPFRDDFLGNFASFFSNDFRKIKYLGRAISGKSAEIRDNSIVFGGQEIPVTPENADEIQALLEKLEEDHREQLAEKESDLKAQKRIVSAKEDVIRKMEKEIKRLERTVTMTDLPPEEQEALDLLVKIQGDLVAAVSTIKQRIDYKSAPVSILRSLYFLYIFGSKVFLEERMLLNSFWDDAEEVPWEITEQELPEPSVLIDNMPATRGMGKAYQEKIDARKKK